MLARGIFLLAAIMLPTAGSAQTSSSPLVAERKIPLGEVSGRIDHLGDDMKRQQLFVAELGNNSLGVVDLAAGRTLRTIGGMSGPQGVAYVPFADDIYVANGGDGSVRILGGEDFAPVGRIELGNDADNVRVDTPRLRVLVGYGKGALAVIDPASRSKRGDFRLKAHPEGFQIDQTSAQVFVNVPEVGAIEAVSLGTGGHRSWPTQRLGSNFPMAIDGESQRVLVVFRSLPTLVALSAEDGHVLAQLDICCDAEDVFVDPRRNRVYVRCGDGMVDVLERAEAGSRRLAQIPTLSGARPSLFVSELGRLFVAVRASSGESAAIWMFRPTP